MIFVIKRSSALLLCAIIIMGIIGAILAKPQDNTAAMATAINQKTVIIDAGHGEPDGGGSGEDGTREAAINLAVAKKLEEIMTQNGCKVIMTRTGENGIYDSSANTIGEKKRSDMYKRRDIQKNSGADIYISIHMNKFEQTQYYGAQVVYDAKDQDSKKLATEIQKALKEGVDPNNERKPMAAGKDIWILKVATIPSVIVECGFLSNPNELSLLKTDEYQTKLAWAIYMGTVNYFSK